MAIEARLFEIIEFSNRTENKPKKNLYPTFNNRQHIY